MAISSGVVSTLPVAYNCNNPHYYRKGTINRIFIGCDLYRGREKHNMFFLIPTNVDFPSLIRIFGSGRAFVHQDILDSIGFLWEEDERISKFHLIA